MTRDAEIHSLNMHFWCVPASAEPELSCSVAGVTRLEVGPSVTAGLQPAERGLS